MLWRIPMATGPVYVAILIDGHNNQLRIRNMLGKSTIVPWIKGAFSEFYMLQNIFQKIATANRPKEPWNSSLPPLDDVVVGGGIMETFAFLATNPPESSVFPRRGRRGSWRDPSYHQRNDRGLVKADAKQQIQRVQEVENM